MPASRSHRRNFPLACLLIAALVLMGGLARAEEDTPTNPNDENAESSQTTTDTTSEEEAPAPAPTPRAPKRRARNGKRRRYMTDVTGRVDAGVFHVGFAAGGNFYIEPQLDPKTGGPLGDYFKDFGFQAGVYFDYNYNEGDSDIPLGLRGMVGYKYILSSVHVFAVEGVARRMFRLAENATFGLGGGVSASVWYRAVTDSSPSSQVIFLPSVVLNAGFDFKPFMVDVKWLINRLGADSSIMGWELSFGFRI